MKVRNPNPIEKPIGEKPSSIFGRRLRETRQERGLSQTELAARMTAVGHSFSKVGVLRAENATRELKLDEAVAFAQVLAIPFADLLEPARDSLIALTDHFATDGDGMRRWLVTGVPISVWPGQMRTRQDRELATEYLRDLAWTIVNAAIARDAESRKYAEQQFSAAIKRAQEQAKEGAEG